ncbi:hypothetical protein GUJ93_ZPchr0337g7096 [Zizania palustris]|uniref:Uncharacterized protein n=1 Tax=Zizania palustris TaxID=103762 RepID=A0A8J5VCF5_ZIZPA|nr:hypothetical protein GUJ93_ZPchr0337g7096 [Zizania palustris]
MEINDGKQAGTSQPTDMKDNHTSQHKIIRSNGATELGTSGGAGGGFRQTPGLHCARADQLNHPPSPVPVVPGRRLNYLDTQPCVIEEVAPFIPPSSVKPRRRSTEPALAPFGSGRRRRVERVAVAEPAARGRSERERVVASGHDALQWSRLDHVTVESWTRPPRPLDASVSRWEPACRLRPGWLPRAQRRVRPPCRRAARRHAVTGASFPGEKFARDGAEKAGTSYWA